MGGHQYWVTAVDSRFNESNPIGPRELVAMSWRDERGLTLIELLVSCTFSLILLGATLTTFNSFERTDRDNDARNDQPSSRAKRWTPRRVSCATSPSAWRAP